MDLRKINNRLWKFIDEEIGEFSPSKFTINRLNNEITVVYFNNLQSKTYNVSDVYVYDVPPATAFNTSNGDELMSKLEELNCPCFQKDETTIIGGAVDSVNGQTGDVVLGASNVLDEDNLGAFMDAYLETKLTPSPNDFILGRDFLTDKAVEINYPIAEGYFNGTNFYLEAGFVNLVQATTGRTYTDLATNLQYRWNGSAYVQLGGGKSKFIVKDFLVATNLTTTWRFRAYASATSYTPTVLDSGTSTFLTALTGSGTSSIPYQTHNTFVAPFDVKLKSIEVCKTDVFGSEPFSLGIGMHLKNDASNIVTDGVSILEVNLLKGSFTNLKKKYTPTDFGDVTLLAGHSIVVGWINQGRGIELYFEFEEV